MVTLTSALILAQSQVGGPILAWVEALALLLVKALVFAMAGLAVVKGFRSFSNGQPVWVTFGYLAAAVLFGGIAYQVPTMVQPGGVAEKIGGSLVQPLEAGN